VIEAIATGPLSLSMDLLIIGFTGALGAILRYQFYVVEKNLPPHLFPYGTLIINLSGCFLGGLILGFSDTLQPSQKHLIALVTIGFVGSFTTFSTFGGETLNLVQSHQLGLAGLNVLLNVSFGMGLIWLGKTLSTSLL
jgi:CrcB protein